MTLGRTVAKKRARLETIIEGLGSAVVAFSGGVDSTLLVAEARRVLGRDKVLAVTAAGDLFPAGEAAEAKALARRLKVRHLVIPVDPLRSKAFRANPPDRCYFCKRAILRRLRRVARERGLAAVCDGANADDPRGHRPGLRAAAELGARSPLKEAGLTKREVRALSRELGLPTWDRPARPCLATRFPYGRAVTREGLARVAAAEEALARLGFDACRVRDHGTVARIEVAPAAIARLARQRAAVVRRLKALGYAYVACDLEGYRSGAMDEVLAPGGARRRGQPG